MTDATRAVKRPDLVDKMRALASMRIGLPGYAAILGSIRLRPMSTTELAEKHKVSRLLVLGVMRHCVRAKIVHRVEWFRPAPHSRMVPRWALGSGGDISMPMYEERARKARRAPSTLILLTTALELMAEHPHTRKELAAALCMHQESAARIVAALRAHKLIHVSGWHKSPVGKPAQEFSVGDKRDAPMPPTVKSDAGIWKQYRDRRAQVSMMQALAGVPQQRMKAAA
jgi:hypothetical protein